MANQCNSSSSVLVWRNLIGVGVGALQSLHDPLHLGQPGLAQLQQLLGLLRVREYLQVVLQAEGGGGGQFWMHQFVVCAIHPTTT